MTINSWPFYDPPNVAVFVDRRIVEEGCWVYYVAHDSDDGAWQFHAQDGFADEENTLVVGLEKIVEMDSRIAELWDLPLGWCAWRETQVSEWQRMAKSP